MLLLFSNFSVPLFASLGFKEINSDSLHDYIDIWVDDGRGYWHQPADWHPPVTITTRILSGKKILIKSIWGLLLSILSIPNIFIKIIIHPNYLNYFFTGTSSLKFLSQYSCLLNIFVASAMTLLVLSFLCTWAQADVLLVLSLLCTCAHTEYAKILEISFISEESKFSLKWYLWIGAFILYPK